MLGCTRTTGSHKHNIHDIIFFLDIGMLVCNYKSVDINTVICDCIYKTI